MSENSSPDKMDSCVAIFIADESSPMSEEAWDYIIERAAARREEERRG